MSVLDVPGAQLYYETHGSGPLLVMIPGASGVADTFRLVTEHLTRHYTVVIYDRRGFSRSELTGPQDYDRRLETDADDVRRLIEHLGDGPATVFGASSGAIVALAVLLHHPSVVATLIPFEPPLMRYLPDGQKWIDFFTETYDLFGQSGVDSALTRFRERTFPETDQRVMARAPHSAANATYWFEHELRQYPAVELDLDTLRTRADRIVLAAGREGIGYPAHDVVAELGWLLGCCVVDLPGGHVGCVAHPAEFARELATAHGAGGGLELTEEGQALREQVDEVRTSPHARLYEGMTEEDLNTTSRVLDTVTERAKALSTNDPGAMSPRDWDDSYTGAPHWDIGRPQPAFEAIAGEFRGRVLDVGCGSGEHVLMCAARGLDATGVDVAAAALRAAEAKARDRGLTARFLSHDVRKLAELGESFDTVLDSGLFHIFHDEDRAAYVDSVRSVLVPGGHYYMLGFSDQQPGHGGPRRLTREDITTAFADGWRIDSIDRTTLDSPNAPIQAWLVAVTKEDNEC